MDKEHSTEEVISALTDGELHGREFTIALELAGQPGAARAAWHDYHLIGDVLRSGETAVADVSPESFSRLQAALASVEIDDLDGSSDSQQKYFAQIRAIIDVEKDAANSSSFRWKFVAGVASTVAIVAIGAKIAISGLWASGGGELARAPTRGPVQTVTAATPPVMLRDPHLDELLAAHRQSGGTSALQMPAGFLRNATFEAPAR